MEYVGMKLPMLNFVPKVFPVRIDTFNSLFFLFSTSCFQSLFLGNCFLDPVKAQKVYKFDTIEPACETFMILLMPMLKYTFVQVGCYTNV